MRNLLGGIEKLRRTVVAHFNAEPPSAPAAPGTPVAIPSAGTPGALLRGGPFLAPGPAYAQNAGVFVTSHTILAESGAGYRCGH